MEISSETMLNEGLDLTHPQPDHPFEIKVAAASQDPIRFDEAEADTLDAALAAAKGLIEDQGEDAVTHVRIRMLPGYRIINGKLEYNAAWL
jgi:hypothetical protein